MCMLVHWELRVYTFGRGAIAPEPECAGAADQLVPALFDTAAVTCQIDVYAVHTGL